MLPTIHPSFFLSLLSFLCTITSTYSLSNYPIACSMLPDRGQIRRSLERSSKPIYTYACTVVRTYVLLRGSGNTPPSAPGARKQSATHSYRYVIYDHCDYYSHSLSPRVCCKLQEHARSAEASIGYNYISFNYTIHPSIPQPTSLTKKEIIMILQNETIRSSIT